MPSRVSCTVEGYERGACQRRIRRRERDEKEGGRHSELGTDPLTRRHAGHSRARAMHPPRHLNTHRNGGGRRRRPSRASRSRRSCGLGSRVSEGSGVLGFIWARREGQGNSDEAAAAERIVRSVHQLTPHSLALTRPHPPNHCTRATREDVQTTAPCPQLTLEAPLHPCAENSWGE